MIWRTGVNPRPEAENWACQYLETLSTAPLRLLWNSSVVIVPSSCSPGALPEGGGAGTSDRAGRGVAEGEGLSGSTAQAAPMITVAANAARCQGLAMVFLPDGPACGAVIVRCCDERCCDTVGVPVVRWRDD